MHADSQIHRLTRDDIGLLRQLNAVFAVAESHRRQGVATRLIERLRAIAHERSAWVVFVQADHGDEPAIALYEKLGVREEVLHFDFAVSRAKALAGAESIEPPRTSG